jgi:hypothetical protein
LSDPPDHGRYTDLCEPRNQLAGHPVAPFLTVPQLPPVKQNLGTALDPFPIRRGLQTPLVFPAPRSTTALGPADDFSPRMIDSYLLTCKYSTTPSHLARFLIHGVFLPESAPSSNPIHSACSVARRWLLTNRVKHIIGRELTHHSPAMDSEQHPHSPPDSPDELRHHTLACRPPYGFREVCLDIPTSCVAVGLLYQLA